MGQKTITTPYDYPVKPGMQEWANFQTGQAMLDACQIPVGILAKLTTNALVETCLNYPLIFDYLSFNDEREGIQFMINNFNGLEELSKRADGASCLLKAYKNTPSHKNRTIELQSDKSPSFMLGYLELLLANKLFIDKFTQEELVDLNNIALEKYTLKLASPDDFGLLSIRRSFLVNSTVIIKSNTLLNNTEKETLQHFINNYQNISPEKLEGISKLIIKK